jgi:thiol:disulfide interchange protein
MLRFKEILLAFALGVIGLASGLNAQIYDPVDWKISLDEKDGKTEIVLTATIEDHWHLYAMQVTDDSDAIVPEPTEITFEANDSYELVGKVTESEPLHIFDKVYELPLSYFEKRAEFRQEIKVLSEEQFKIKALVYFMACDDEKCTIPSEEEYEVTVNQGVASSTDQGMDLSSSGDDSGILTPVKWSAESKDLGNGEFEVILTAYIDEHWHIYSQVLDNDMGPLPTTFFFNETEGVEFIDGVKEGESIREYDPNFMMDLNFFEGQPQFVQKLKITGDAKPLINCSVDFMACDDEKCLPPDLVEFEIDLATGKGKVNGLDVDPSSLLKLDEIIPTLGNLDLTNPVNSCGEIQEISNVWMVFLFGFLGGLIALLTPCVFPMIPLTVSFFTKGGKDKKNGIRQAVLYGFFIFLIYALLSIPFHFGTDPAVLSEIATSVALNVIFFVVFIVFAISFFGYFEITLPNSFVNKVDNASNVGGILGIFFMALTLALVSFSCTGPILGTVLGSSLKDGPWPVTAAMSGFGIALGLPFSVFAAFPQWLNSMPKSGGWLNVVKVVLGFIEVALAIKFLSNADLVEQWGLLKRETFFVIWFVVGLGLSAYLFGLIKFPHDSPIKKLSKFRLGFAMAVLAFTIYLIPGVLKNSPWNHNLLSGFPPPTFYSWYEASEDDHDETFHPEFDDFDAALAEAKEKNLPILIDFTGWACVNCRKMEESVWTQPGVKALLQEEFVVVSLYVDDKVELPEEKQGVFEYEANGEKQVKKIRTIGNKWATFQTQAFRNNSQPYYVMLSSDGHLLGNPVGYTPNVQEYEDYLKCGISANQQLGSK